MKSVSDMNGFNIEELNCFECLWNLFRFNRPRESCAFVLPVGVFIEVVSDWVLIGWQTASYVFTFDTENGEFFVILVIPMIGMG